MKVVAFSKSSKISTSNSSPLELFHNAQSDKGWLSWKSWLIKWQHYNAFWFKSNTVVHCPLSRVPGENSLTPPSSSSRFTRLFRLTHSRPACPWTQWSTAWTGKQRLGGFQRCKARSRVTVWQPHKIVETMKINIWWKKTCRDSKCRSWERSWGARGCLLVLGKSETQSRWESEK